MGTFVLVPTIFMVAIDRRAEQYAKLAPFAISSALTAGVLLSGAISGGSLNPASAPGPALFANLWQNHIVYRLGPVFGAVLAVLAYSYVLKE